MQVETKDILYISFMVSLVAYGGYSHFLNGISFFRAYAVFSMQAFALAAVIAVIALLVNNKVINNKFLLGLGFLVLGSIGYVFLMPSMVFDVGVLVFALVLSGIVVLAHYCLHIDQDEKLSVKVGKVGGFFCFLLIVTFLIQVSVAYAPISFLSLVLFLELLPLIVLQATQVYQQLVDKANKYNKLALSSSLYTLKTPKPRVTSSSFAPSTSTKLIREARSFEVPSFVKRDLFNSQNDGFDD